MSGTRQAAVAGMFYPANPTQLHDEIHQMLSVIPDRNSAPKAMIVPHAGYIYSGPVAASAFAQLISLKTTIKRVILLGPCHRVPLDGLATTSADYFETPLGSIAVDRDSIDTIMRLPQVKEFDLTHQQEHSLEVQLPFLQETLDAFTLVPLVVGESSPNDICEVLELLWGGEETLIVVSSDLSHYHNYETAQAMDQQTCNAIENFDIKAIHYEQACGRNPVLGLLQSALHHHMKVSTLDLRNSGDTAGNRDQVVGYGAWIFEEN